MTTVLLQVCIHRTGRRTTGKSRCQVNLEKVDLHSHCMEQSSHSDGGKSSFPSLRYLGRLTSLSVNLWLVQVMPDHPQMLFKDRTKYTDSRAQSPSSNSRERVTVRKHGNNTCNSWIVRRWNKYFQIPHRFSRHWKSLLMSSLLWGEPFHFQKFHWMIRFVKRRLFWPCLYCSLG